MSFIAREEALPELLAQSKAANATAWKEYHQKKRDYFQMCLFDELFLLDMEKRHQEIIEKHLRESDIDCAETSVLFGMEQEEKNMWAALRQVGPVPSVTPATPTTLEDYTDLIIPSFATSFPYQGSKIWDWIGASRSRIEDPLPILDVHVDASSSSSTSPSSSRASPDLEAVQSSASSDSGLGTESSAPKTVKPRKVDTAEEIERRKRLVEEWKSKIQECLLA